MTEQEESGYFPCRKMLNRVEDNEYDPEDDYYEVKTYEVWEIATVVKAKSEAEAKKLAGDSQGTIEFVQLEEKIYKSDWKAKVITDAEAKKTIGEVVK